MHWLYLLISVVVLVLSLLTKSLALMIGCWLVSLALVVLWLVVMYSERVASRERDASLMIDPLELRRLREQAEARKAAQAQDPQA